MRRMVFAVLTSLALSAFAHAQEPPPPLPSLIHPVTGKVEWTDPFGAERDGGKRRHEGFDMGAPKLRPVVACFDGTVSLTTGMGGLGRAVFLRGDCGWSATYAHLNDDNPGTDDDSAELRLTFSSGIQEGSHVRAGQLLGYLGNSGNAKYAGSHLHFELSPPGGGIVDPTPHLKKARLLAKPIPVGQVALPTAASRPAPTPLQLVELPDEPLSGMATIQTSADPTPRKASTYYTVCVDGQERLRFTLTPGIARLNTQLFPDGSHTLTLQRRDSATGGSYQAHRVVITIRNRASELPRK